MLPVRCVTYVPGLYQVRPNMRWSRQRVCHLPKDLRIERAAAQR
jgi:hypothetical protein